MKLNKLKLSICLPALLLAACASTPEYEALSSTSTKLRVALVEGPVSNLPNDLTGETMHVKIYEEASCEGEKEFGFLHSPNDEKTKAGKLDMPLGAYSKSAVHEAPIEANRTFRVEVNFGILNGSPIFGKVEKCDISVDYEFDEGVDYELVGVMEAFDACSVKINKLTSIGGTPMRQTIKTLTHIDHPIPAACTAEDNK